MNNSRTDSENDQCKISSEDVINLIMPKIDEGIVVFDGRNLQIIYSNLAAQKIFSLKKNGTSPTLQQLLSSNLIVSNSEKTDLAKLSDSSSVRFSSKSKLKIIYEIQLSKINLRGHKYVLGIIKNLSDKINAAQSALKFSYTDSLTNLPNRARFHEYLVRQFAQKSKKDFRLALIHIDLDRFKVINDLYGHEVGDKLLKQTANRLKKIIPSPLVLSRVSSDEFIIVYKDFESLDDLKSLAQDLLGVFVEPFGVGDNEIYVNASIGIAHALDRGVTAEGLIKNVETALSKAKEMGGNSLSFFAESMTPRAGFSKKIETEFRKALKHSQLEVYYQPVVDSKNAKICSAEALIRWNHPKHGIIMPSDFIPMAEETGLIVEMGRQVLEQVCSDIKRWSKKNLNFVPISFNISPKELMRPDLISVLSKIIDKYNIPKDVLKLELTETFLMKNIDFVNGILEQLQLMGIKIMIDDFGVGYASISYLKRLPVNAVKIDKSYINGCAQNLQDAALSSAIIDLSHKLGLEVVAEGVEDKSQVSFLKKENCDFIQGFYYYKPVPRSEFEQLII